MIDIKAIKNAAEAATKGEWSWQEGTPLVTKLWNGAEHSIAAVDWRTLAWHEDGNCAGRESGANAKHIATANPATVSAMCDEIERLQLKLEVSDKTGYDGIDCRDETIRLQDEEIDRLTIIASELQDLCDRQAKRLAEVEKEAFTKSAQICQTWIDDHSKADNCTYNDCDMVAAVTDVMNQIKGIMK